MRKLWWWGLMLGTVPAAWASEPVHGCFRTAAEAAAGVAAGPSSEGDGYRVEGVRRDAVLGRNWAVVRNCAHPERPAVMVEMLREAATVAAPAVATVALDRVAGAQALPAALLGERGRSRARDAQAARISAGTPPPTPLSVGATASPAKAQSGMPVLSAGARVEVVRVEQNVRLTLLAVAERSAYLGERVRLRVVRETGESEQFVEGVVRSAALVEMEAGR